MNNYKVILYQYGNMWECFILYNEMIIFHAYYSKCIAELHEFLEKLIYCLHQGKKTYIDNIENSKITNIINWINTFEPNNGTSFYKAKICAMFEFDVVNNKVWTLNTCYYR